MNEKQGGGPVRGISSQTGPPLRLQWETGSRVIHLYDPPEPVSISMRSIDPVIGQPGYSSSPTHPSLRVRAAGIRVEPAVDGYLLTAVRPSDGQWRAIVHIELRSANGRTGIQVPVWVQPEAVRRKEDL
ncbi:hypothetical protein GCM10023197_45800 [Gordonia humi]